MSVITAQPDQVKGVIWNADYSQLELRIFAAVTGCRWMVETFQDPDGDIHKATAMRVLGATPEQAKEANVRTRAKNLNFGMAYGMTGETLQEQIIVFALRNPDMPIRIPSLVECEQMVRDYWKAAPEAAAWRDLIIDAARDRGYSETLYGWRIYLPHLRASNQGLRRHAERLAVNHVIQGTGAQIIKMAALLLYDEAPKYRADIRAQIHDELMGRVFGDERNNLAWLRVVEECMLLDQPLMGVGNVPLKIEPKLVKDWKEAK